MVKTDGIRSQEPAGVILRRFEKASCSLGLGQCIDCCSVPLLFLVTVLVVEFSLSTVWYGILQKWVRRGADF